MIHFIQHGYFEKDFKKLPQNIRDAFLERIHLFSINPYDPILKDHALKGHLIGKRSFSVTGDIRVIYRYIDETTVLLLQIGSHNQVY